MLLISLLANVSILNASFICTRPFFYHTDFTALGDSLWADDVHMDYYVYLTLTNYSVMCVFAGKELELMVLL
jgi:hypothetical protein